MRIELKEINLENYKCFESKHIELFHRTKISGKNKEGKSTIQDSYYDVMTGKMANGAQPDRIRPHDKSGVDVDKVDCIRELHLEIDGNPVIIRKRTFQKWKKPKGKTEEVFGGNGVDYEVDGFPYKPEKFNEYISGIASQDTILLCGNANTFLNALQASTSEARKLLEKLAGFSIEKFISENPKYKHIEEIAKGHSVEDTTKKLKKQLSEQNKKLDAQNAKIKYEKTRSSDKPEVEVSDLELMKAEWTEKLSELDEEEQKLDDMAKTCDDLSAEIAALKKRRESIVNSANGENNKKRESLDWQIAELNRKKKMLSDDLRYAEMDFRQASMGIQRYMTALEKARVDYAEYSTKEFDESKLHEIKAEEFDEDSLICPTCGQAFPEDKQLEIKERFTQSKKQRIADQEEARKKFGESLELQLQSITYSGNEAKRELHGAEKRKADIDKKVEEIKNNISSVSIDIENMNKEYNSIPESVDLSLNPDYMEIQSQITETETKLSSINNGSERRKELRKHRNSCMDEISKIEVRIQKIIADEEEKERNLTKLESELREISQVAADVEKQIDMVSEFSREKNKALAKTINPYFHHFQFSFLEFTIEGNPVETCKIICGGTDYMKGLNGGDKKLCEIDLCRGLQELNNLCLPIWIDEANTIDPWRIPQDLEQQLILISRDDGNLKVEEMA